MATKRTTKKTAKKAVKKGASLNSSIVNATKAAINTTVENGEKWQKLTKKLIKKSEPVRRKQMDMVFDTATAVKDQVNSGTERMMDLVGFDTEIVDKAVKFAKKNPVSKKVMDVADDIMETVSENPVVKQVERTTEDIKNMGVAKFNDVKEDVLEQAQKILNKGEELVEDALGTKKIKKQARKAPAKAKKVVKKATAAKKKTVAKTATVKKTTNRATTTTKKAVVKAPAVKAATKAVVKETKKVTATVKASVKDDLKIIRGIGPKLESIFNKNGIKTFAQLANAEKAKIQTVLEQAGPLFKNMETADWKKQAAVGAAEGVEGLTKWIARYRTS